MSYDFNKAIDIFKTTVTTQFWDVDGRTSRSDFWHYVSISFLIWVVVEVVGVAIPILGFLLFLGLLVLVPPGIGLGIRRAHDTGREWWHGIIPFYNIYIACLPGDKGPNEYGEDPLGGSAAAFE